MRHHGRVLVPALAITKTVDSAEVAAGYTITATKGGQADYPAGTTLTDNLVAVLDHAVYTDGSHRSHGHPRLCSHTLTWTGAIPKGASVTIAYPVTTNRAGDRGAAATNSDVTWITVSRDSRRRRVRPQ